MDDLKKELRSFVEKRDWGKFHSPKNLAIGLNIEASELLELFLWLTEDESQNLDANQIARLQEEIGDVMIYLIYLADKFNLDPMQCARNKLRINNEKYPVALARGSAKKYTELSS
jgi:dCTP diphosphatase